MRGTKKEAIIAAVLYMACKEELVPRTFKELAKETGIKEKDIRKFYRNLAALLPKTVNTAQAVSPVDLVVRSGYFSDPILGPILMVSLRTASVPSSSSLTKLSQPHALLQIKPPRNSKAKVLALSLLLAFWWLPNWATKSDGRRILPRLLAFHRRLLETFTKKCKCFLVCCPSKIPRPKRISDFSLMAQREQR